MGPSCAFLFVAAFWSLGLAQNDPAEFPVFPELAPFPILGPFPQWDDWEPPPEQPQIVAPSPSAQQPQQPLLQQQSRPQTFQQQFVPRRVQQVPRQVIVPQQQVVQPRVVQPQPQPRVVQPQPQPRPQPQPAVVQQSLPQPQPTGRRLGAVEQLQQCCRQNPLIPPSCYNLCNPYNFNRQALVRSYLRRTCPMEAAGEIIRCATTRQDLRGCCLGRGVSPQCAVFCDGSRPFPPIDRSYMPCLRQLNQIRDCYIQHMNTDNIRK